MAGGVRVFIACSLDGFIAGPDDDLSWLPAPDASGEDYGYGAFIAETAAILMGRSTYDVAAGFPDWPYGSLPVFVATSRPLDPVAETVVPISGSPSELLAAVRARQDGAVYLDGGALIRSFLDEESRRRAHGDDRQRDPRARRAAVRRASATVVGSR